MLFFLIFGIIAVAVGVAKTGLDKRIGLILLSRIKSTKAFAFMFLPMLAISERVFCPSMPWWLS